MLPGIIGRGRRLVQQRAYPPIAHRDRRDPGPPAAVHGHDVRRRAAKPVPQPVPGQPVRERFVAGDGPRLRGRVPERDSVTDQGKSSSQHRHRRGAPAGQ
jgi:hypothetical protein